jgi:hypothetical protein
MKKIIALAFIMLLTACERKTVDVAGNYAIPQELSDCIFRRMYSHTASFITVVRCPNSATTTVQSDKAHTTTIVVDGVTYSKVGE